MIYLKGHASDVTIGMTNNCRGGVGVQNRIREEGRGRNEGKHLKRLVDKGEIKVS